MSPPDNAAPYDDFAAAYAEHAAANPFQTLYDRPAILDLAGDVAGLDVLDLGCAAGHLAAELAHRGARVTGLDLSTGMVAEARRRFGGLATFTVGDLAEPLDLPTASVDLVTASLVLHYLEDWGPALGELRRVLRPGGVVVASTHHPEDWHWFDGTRYFATEQLTDTWAVGGRPQEVRFWRRPLGEIFGAYRQAGFTVDALVEPRPLPACEASHPRAWQVLTEGPRFLYARLVAPG